jgi:Na+/H+-dicarboxylate symporter/ABC-type amino acid transport substrate-binding protein
MGNGGGRGRSGSANAILLGLGLGIACGLFIGEPAGHLGVLADAFIRLLQMAVLPYITVSLTAAVGRLSAREARVVAGSGGRALLLLWAIVLVLVVASAFGLPGGRAGFYSTSAVTAPQAFDLLDLYIPANPFRSLSDNVVPAVVLFCLAVGVALMGVPGREPLIAILDVLTKAFARVNDFVMKLMPYGVFAIAASSAGTLGIEDLGRVQVYLVSFVALALFATFWLLPATIAAFTPVRHRDVLRASRETLATAFSTGSLLVVLPSLAQTGRDLVARTGVEEPRAAAAVDVLVPVSFNFPHAGKVLTLGFVVFAAWFAGMPLGAAELMRLCAIGLLAAFGSMNVALPFLLDVFLVPTDLFQLFLAIGIVSFRFQTLLGAMHTLAAAVLGACAMEGRFAVRAPAVVRLVALGGIGLALTLAASRALSDWTMTRIASGTAPVLAREFLVAPVAATLMRASVAPPPASGFSAIERAANSGTLRVGYDPDRLPFSYFNARGRLVGYDVELAHRLARELGATLVFVPIDHARLGAQLEQGEIDLALGGIEVTTERSRTVAFTTPYLHLTLAFVVRDDRRAEFSTRADLQAHRHLRIGIVLDGYYEAKLRAYVPAAEIVRVKSEKAFFEGNGLGLDALVDAAEVGAAWSLLYPSFTVAIPNPDRLNAPVALAVARGDTELRAFLDTWLLLKREDGTLDQLREHWILGRNDGRRGPRWSVIRDVLHWVE